jgi:hypothetical protein
MHAAGKPALPAPAVENMGAHSAFLRNADFLIPINSVVRAGVHKRLIPQRRPNINKHNPILPPTNTFGVSLYTSGVSAMPANQRQISNIDPGVLPALLAQNIHPAMPMARLGMSDRQPLIINMLIQASHKAIITIMAKTNITNYIVLFHRKIPQITVVISQ